MRLFRVLATVQVRPEIGSNSTTLALATSRPRTRSNALMVVLEGFMVVTPASDCLRARFAAAHSSQQAGRSRLRRRTLMTTGFRAPSRNGHGDGGRLPGWPAANPLHRPTHSSQSPTD